MGPRVADAKSSLHLLGSSAVASYNFWAGLLPSLGASGYYSVIPLPQNHNYVLPESPRTDGCSVHFFPLILGTLAPTVCLPAGRGRGRLAHGTCCDLAVILLLMEHFFFAKKSSARGLYQHPCLVLMSYLCEAYQGAGCWAYHKHPICQHLPSFTAVSHILGYQYRPFF